MNAIFYVLSTGCQWQALPKELLPKGTAHYYFMLWDWDGTLERIHQCSMSRRVNAKATRRPDGREHRQPKRQGRSRGGSALDPQGYAGKKVTGRKRHILVDTLGLLLNVVIHAADVQDRDGAQLVLNQRTRRLFPFIERIVADAGYQGSQLAAAVAKTGTWTLEIVKRHELHRFVILPKRWIVERTQLQDGAPVWHLTSGSGTTRPSHRYQAKVGFRG